MPFLALLKLIPLKDWLWGLLATVLIGFSWHTYSKYETAVKYAAQLKAESVTLQADAKKDIAEKTSAHTQELSQLKDQLHESETATTAARNSESQRVRDFETYRRSHPNVQNSSTGSGSNSSGNSSAPVVTDFLSSLEPVAELLADSVRQLDSSLTACVTDRNSLTGK